MAEVPLTLRTTRCLQVDNAVKIVKELGKILMIFYSKLSLLSSKFYYNCDHFRISMVLCTREAIL